MREIGFGVVGAGTWGGVHSQVYAYTPGARLVAVADADEGKANAVAREHGARACTDWRELIDDDSIHAISVVTPDFAHYEIALAAAKAGKHLLVEKPLAMKVAECEEIIAAAESSGAHIMVDFHARWAPTFYRAWETIRKGEIGKPRHAYYRLNDRIWVPTEMLSWAAKSSVAWFLGTHAVDTVRWMFDDEVRRVYAVRGQGVLKGLGVDTPDYYQATLEFRGGGTAVVETSWIMPNSMPNLIDLKLSVVGDEGAVYVDGSHHRAVEKYTATDAGFPDVFVVPKIWGETKGFAVDSIRYFATCIVCGEKPMVTGRDGLEVTKVVVAIEESARTGLPVEIF